MTPAECYTTMQGTDGLGQGLTTYPNSPEADAKYTHECCLALEASGGCYRHTEGATYEHGADVSQAQHFVIWMPIAGATPPEPPPLPEPDAPPADAPPADEPPAA